MDENPNLNRIKVALVERQKTSKWLAEQMENQTPLFPVGYPTKFSHRWSSYLKLLAS